MYLRYKFYSCTGLNKAAILKAIYSNSVFGLRNLVTLLHRTGYTWCFCHFLKGDNFCDFLFAFLHTKYIIKKGSATKEFFSF